MGKRELLIIVAFVAIGFVAYELTAPPPKEGEGFSLSKIFRNVRQGIQNDQPLASTTTSGTIIVGPSVTELRIPSTPRGVEVIGEDRRDIQYELRVESSGPDQPTALDYAKRTSIKQDDMGSSLQISVDYPKEAKQWSGLTLHVPSRMTARFISGMSGVRAKKLAGVEFDRIGGLATLEDIDGPVTGTVTGGELSVTAATTVNMTLGATRARFTRIAKGLTLTTQRGGRCEVTASLGSLVLEETNTDVLIDGQGGTIKVTGSSGRVNIENPKQSVSLEVRSAAISLTLHTPVMASVIGSGERIRVLFDGSPAVIVDAIATGHVDASEFGLTPESTPGQDQEERLVHSFGGATSPRITLRNSRGDIVIGKRK